MTGTVPPSGQHNYDPYPQDPSWQQPGPYYQPQPPPQPPRRGMSTGAILGICAAVVAVLCVAASVAVALMPTPEDKPAATSTVDPDGMGEPQGAAPAAPTAAPTTASPPPPAGPRTSFGDGTWEIGTGAGQVAPGKYRTTVPQDSWNCYWERLKGTSGSFDDIIANDNVDPGSPTVITIAASDAAFKSKGCGTWSKA